jgi:hypothetical protein
MTTKKAFIILALLAFVSAGAFAFYYFSSSKKTGEAPEAKPEPTIEKIIDKKIEEKASEISGIAKERALTRPKITSESEERLPRTGLPHAPALGNGFPGYRRSGRKIAQSRAQARKRGGTERAHRGSDAP